MKRQHRNVKGWQVMKAMCPTCPFGPNGDPDVMNGVMSRIVEIKRSQICHHPVLHGKKETQLCRGARDIQLKILCAIGAIAEPTDKAFMAKSKSLGVA